ncbi:RHS repeat-associated core domain-containing protein [Pseudomonas sp. Tri1]|uniref:RHS repeat-associated core domain-containing protein n=1 Tax=Pseudomonas sp. Tri1 TaxID=2823875 RepID=UPI001B32ABD2|nr:RHS repeat-associated core domain-containing protein [Pseudomonas sp. Tri1]
MSQMKILCLYQYDPLDRLVGLKPLESPGTQRFYQEDELVNEIEGQSQLTIMRHGPQPLAQRSGTADVTETTLLATDQQHSLLKTVTDTNLQQMAYTAYGYRSGESGLSCLLGFHGAPPDSITGHYLLGQGNRAFNPALMRFNSPDELSPFGDGGINAYAYCGGDPVNRYDPSGNAPFFRPWVRYFRPWETKPNASGTLSSSSKTTSPRVSPPASQITKAEVSSALATPAAAVPEQSDKTFILPWEQSAYGLKRPGSSLTRQGRWKRARAESAREFDKFVKKNGWVPISGDPQWPKKYLQAEADLTELLKNKTSTAVKRNARARVQETRHELKWRLLKAMKAAQAIRTDQ